MRSFKHPLQSCTATPVAAPPAHRPRTAMLARVALAAWATAAGVSGCGARQHAPVGPTLATLDAAFELASREVWRASRRATDAALPTNEDVAARLAAGREALAAGRFIVAVEDLGFVDRVWRNYSAHLPDLARAQWLAGVDGSVLLATVERCLGARAGGGSCEEIAPHARLATGDAAGAEADWRALLARDARRDDIAERVARLALDRGDGAACTADLGPRVAARPGQVRLRLLFAACAEATGDLATAERQITLAAREHHDRPSGQALLIAFYERTGRPADAARVRREMEREMQRAAARRQPRRAMRPL